MHILDLIMYFVCAGIIWFIMDKGWQGEITNELGGLIGMFVMIIFTILYVIVFAFYPDWNWSEFNYSAIPHWFKW